MDHLAGFVEIGKRNGELRREMATLRLEKRLREMGEPDPGSGLATPVSKGVLPLMSRLGLSGQGE